MQQNKDSVETPVWTAKPSQWMNWPIITGTFIVIVVTNLLLPWPWRLIGLVALLPCGWAWWKTAVARYELTTQRLRVITGPIIRKTEEIELYKVEDTGTVAPLILRMMGYGHIEILGMDYSAPEQRLAALNQYEARRDEIRDIVRAERIRRGVRIIEH